MTGSACARCGQPREKDARFCTSCGQDWLTPPSSPSPIAAAGEPARPRVPQPGAPAKGGLSWTQSSLVVTGLGVVLYLTGVPVLRGLGSLTVVAGLAVFITILLTRASSAPKATSMPRTARTPAVSPPSGSSRETWESRASRGDQVVVVTYRAKNAAAASELFRRDSAIAALHRYRPTSQNWAQGQWGCGAFLVAVLLFLVLIGILVFIYMLLVKPEGTLSVTYTREPQAAQREAQVEARPASKPADTKICPDCAETVMAAANICRYCRHEFQSSDVGKPPVIDAE